MAGKPKPPPQPVEVPLREQAALAVQLEQRGERAGAYWGALDIRRPGSASAQALELPSRWGIVHVMIRIEEMYLTLARLPMSTRPRGHANSMPRYVYERFDLNAQFETYELEKLMRRRNVVRARPSPSEIARMEQAMGWFGRYLADTPEVAKAVQLAARWHVFDGDVGEGCKAMGISRRTLRRRQVHGLQLIAAGLILDRVPVS
jgi:hypothetical protein